MGQVMMQDDKIQKNGRKPLDNHLHIERIYDADREAMLAALRVVLGLPKARPADLEVK